MQPANIPIQRIAIYSGATASADFVANFINNAVLDVDDLAPVEMFEPDSKIKALRIKFIPNAGAPRIDIECNALAGIRSFIPPGRAVYKANLRVVIWWKCDILKEVPWKC